jgi:hypothetical protein
MILSAYVIGSTGEIVYAKVYTNDASSNSVTLPDFAENIITLYRTSESTRLEHAYFHEREGQVWVFVFFEQFVIVLQTTEDENRTSTKRRIVSMGRTIASVSGGLERTWIDDSDLTQDFDAIVDRYVTLDFTTITDSLLAVVELAIYSALEKYNIAYAGVFNAQGQQIKGNVPVNHAREIGLQVHQGTLKPAVDIVPSTVLIEGHEVQLLKVQYLTVVAAPYRNSSRLPATKAVGEMAESLRDAISKLNKTAK